MGHCLLYGLATLGCLFAASIEQLITWRFLQALGGAGALVLARTVARDLFGLAQAAKVMSWMHMLTMMATLVAPMIGTWLVLIDGWRTIFAVLFILCTLCLLMVATGLGESLAPQARSGSLKGAFVAYPYILQQPNIFSIIVVSFINARCVTRLGPKRLLGIGAALSSVAGLALLVAGYTQWGGLSSIVLCLMLYMGVTGLLGANCTASLMNLFPTQAGASVALGIAVQFAFG